MTSTQRFKRSCWYAAVVVVASVIASVALGLVTNPNTPSTKAVDLAGDFLGAPLGTGYVLLKPAIGDLGSCSSVGQFLVSVFLIIALSLAIDAGLIFGVWQLISWKKTKNSSTPGGLHIS